MSLADLFQPVVIVPRPTRIVRLNGPIALKGEGKPRPVKRALDMSPSAVKRRNRQAEWVHNKRRADDDWRQECNRRERERYASMSAEKKAERLVQMAEVKAALACLGDQWTAPIDEANARRGAMLGDANA